MQGFKEVKAFCDPLTQQPLNGVISTQVALPDGTILDSGAFKDGVPTGHMSALLPDGCIYQGDLSRCLPHGPGNIQFSTKAGRGSYHGNWVNGKA